MIFSNSTKHNKTKQILTNVKNNSLLNSLLILFNILNYKNKMKQIVLAFFYHIYIYLYKFIIQVNSAIRLLVLVWLFIIFCFICYSVFCLYIDMSDWLSNQAFNLSLLSSSQISLVKGVDEVNNLITQSKDSNKIKLSRKVNKIIIPFKDLTETKFIETLILNLSTNSLNTILFQYSELQTFTHLMLGSQVGIVIKDLHDIKYYKLLFEHYKDMLESVMSRYYVDTPDFIIIHLIELSVDEKLQIGKLPQLSTKLVTIKENKTNFNNNILPLTLVETNYGTLLQGQIRINYLEALIKNLETNNLSLPLGFKASYSSLKLDLANDNITIQLKDEKVQLDFLKQVLVSSEENLENKFKVFISKNKFYLIITYISNKYNYNRIVFKIKTGKLLFCGKDSFDKEILKFLNKDTSKHFVREIGNLSASLNKDNEVELYTKTIKLSPIVYNNPEIKNRKGKASKVFTLDNKPALTKNPRIGTLDLETFNDVLVNGEIFARVYALGFATDSNNIKMYYLTDHFDNTIEGSNKLVLKCIDEIFEYELGGYTFYVHNLGKFDAIFIHKILLDHNTQAKDSYAVKYNTKAIYRDGKIISLEIVKTVKNKNIKIKLVDSLNILNNSLDKLCSDFGLNYKKGIFPYNFVNKNNLNYIGVTPDIQFWINKYNKNVNLDFYNEIKKNNWSLREETLKYLELDLSCLLEVIKKFQEILWEDHNIELTNSLTIASLAKNKFLKYYLKDSQIPLINNNNLFQFIYGGYFGGITEVYKPIANFFNYLDVNSLYPFAALNPMPALDCKWIESFNSEGLDLSKLFGVFFAKVETNDQYLGLLPLRTKAGIIFPEGKFEGIWATPELNMAKSHGYKITVIKGFQFNKQKSPFIDYVQELSALKDKLKGSPRQVVKNLLNNLIGRFGLNFVKPITKTVSKAGLDKILATKEVKTFKEINEENYLVTFYPIVNKDICDSHNLDYFKVLLEEKGTQLRQNAIFKDVSLVTAAFVTSYARVYMQKIKLAILEVGGLIYYSDTDSIVTNLSLKTLSKKLPSKIGNKLGQLKLEHTGEKAYFISNKTYILLTTKDKEIIKAKGIFSDSLSLADFENMYLNSKSVQGEKSSTITNYSRGSVTIQTKNITIDWNSFKKREKLFDSNNLWIDTKPIYIDNLSRSITLYRPLNIIKASSKPKPKPKPNCRFNLQPIKTNKNKKQNKQKQTK